ncbi:MAG: efflux RND transporter periplasmic adaptor subunit, partial [Sedimenticola sp.]
LLMSIGSYQQVNALTSGSSDQADSQDTWGNFADSVGSSEFPALWLTLLCTQIPAVRSGMVLLGSANRGPFAPAAVWPDPARDLTHLTPAAERTLRERRGFANRRIVNSDASDAPVYDLTYPLLVGDALHGAIVVEVADLSGAALQDVLRQIHWGAASLELELHKRERVAGVEARQQVFALLDLIAVAVEEERFQSAASALVTELATLLHCDRVSLGLLKGRQMQVQAISHSATFGRQMNLTRLIEAAMDEAVDQETRIWWPSDDETKLVDAHQELVQQQGAPEICTLPIRVRGNWEVVLTLEFPTGHRLSTLDADFCETVGEIAAPLLLCKREQERWLIVKAWGVARKQVGRLFGPAYLGRKLVAMMIFLFVLFFTFAEGDYRITANSTLEGGELRALTVPFNGYIDSASARAGERVTAGDLLATLDDRDLKLEQVRISTERAQYRRERRQAAADHDRALVRILSAQIEQAEAQLRLIEEQLERTRIQAPFDGIIVSGDLSQSLGAPVQQGDVLFELAPQDRYRVKLAVGEADIDDVTSGQSGTLVLAALPHQPIPLEVTLITPVTTVEDGLNTFKVEALLTEVPANLRPGMEGVGKIDVGERRLIWIWTRGFMQWARLQLWAWWP